MLLRFLALMTVLATLLVQSAEITSIEGEGRFVPTGDDSSTFIKEQLQASALREIVTKEMRAMGLDPDSYWQQYDTKFEEYFRPIAAELRQKMNVPEGKSTPEFLRAVRGKRLSAYAKFGRLDRCLVGFSDRGVTRNPLRPDERLLTLTARIDRNVLASSYARMTTSTEYKRIKTIYLTFVPVLESVTWEELGVATSTDLTNVVEDTWLKWMQEQMKSENHDVTIEVVPPSQSEKLEKQLKAEPAIGDDARGPYANAAWLRIQFFIRKTNDDEKTKERSFQINADFVMIDLATQKSLLHADIPNENVTYSTSDGHALSSNLASLIYRMPMVEWANLTKAVSSIPVRSGNVRLTVKKANSVADILEFTEVLNIRAASFRPEATLENFSTRQATIDFNFSGPVEKLQDLMLAMNQQNLGNGLTVIIDDKSKPFEFSLTRVESAPAPLAPTETESKANEAP